MTALLSSRETGFKNVGVILPLSKREDLPLHYGTRHRAAAGTAEQSDAMVLVASEERGEVVVAKGPGVDDSSKTGSPGKITLQSFGKAR